MGSTGTNQNEFTYITSANHIPINKKSGKVFKYSLEKWGSFHNGRTEYAQRLSSPKISYTHPRIWYTWGSYRFGPRVYVRRQWRKAIQQLPTPGLRTVTKQAMLIFGAVLLAVQMGDLQVRTCFESLKSCKWMCN